MAVQPLIGRAVGIDGLAWLDSGDRAIVRYLRTQPRATTLAEATGGAYTEYARISSASGVPAILGWANHELVWRGHEVSAETDARRRLVERIYRSEEPELVTAAVREAGVDFVVIGLILMAFVAFGEDHPNAPDASDDGSDDAHTPARRGPVEQ